MTKPFRWVGMASVLAATLFGSTFLFSGCGDPKNLPQFVQDQLSKVRPTASTPQEPSQRQASFPAPAPGETIRIASFNIQVFGTKKLSKTGVMEILAEVVRNFDVVAIQEVRSQSDDILPQFVKMINQNGGHYEFLIGPRQGRTNSTEQYAFIYDAARIEFDPRTVFMIDDPDDLLHREPMVARFRVRGLGDEAFSFTLINIHTDPDEARAEVDALAKVYTSVQADPSHEDDVIVLGDLNIDETRLGKLGALPHMVHAITGVATNTRGDKMYDNIVFNGEATTEFTGRTGVLDLQVQYGLTLQQALEVSDHLPVWAEFSARESAPAGTLANRPRPDRR